MSRKLVVSDGTRQRELQLVGRLVVGRDPTCDITYDHTLLSRRHAEFVSAGDLVVVRDLGSRNGVFVNGTKTAEQSLRPGDVVQIGPLRAQYVFDAAPLSIAPEDHDADRTAVIRGASAVSPPKSAVAAAAGAAAAAGSSPVAENDDDATRLISSSRSSDAGGPESHGRWEHAADLLARPAAPPENTDDDVTRFIAAPHERPALSEEMPQQAVASAAPLRSLRNFVFVQLLLLGGLVVAASILSLRAGGATPTLMSLVVPVVVAVAGGYLVSGVIDRRFIHTVADRHHRK